jgi:hypothetical protein
MPPHNFSSLIKASIIVATCSGFAKVVAGNSNGQLINIYITTKG